MQKSKNMKKYIILPVYFILLACLVNGQSLTEVQKILAGDGTADAQFGSSVYVSGDYAIVGSPGDADYGSNSGAAYIFHRNEDKQWVEMKKIVASDIAAEDVFGISVSISGNYAIVGASRDDDYTSNTGSAYIFQKDHGGINNWGELIKLTASDPDYYAYFGNSVSITGDYAIVGAYNDDNNGSAYIFHKDQDGTNSWGQLTKLTASDGASGDYFGYSVSLSGDYAIVGASYDDDNGTNSGSAYVFYKDQGGTNNWGEMTKLIASDRNTADYFGRSVSLSVDYVIVGAQYDDDNGTSSGSAYVFHKEQGGTNNWGELTKLLASDGDEYDYFGYSVSILGDYAIVGAYGDDDNGSYSGSAYVFYKEQGGSNNWGELTKLTASDGAASDYFGSSVSLSGDYAIVGAYHDDDNGSNSGSAYIFGEPRIINHPEDQNQYQDGEVLFTVSDNGITDFQWQIKRDGENTFRNLSDTLVFDGINNESLVFTAHDSLHNSQYRCIGSSLFGRDTSQAATFILKDLLYEIREILASDGAAGDYFGWSVSLSGDYAIVGAYQDDDNGSSSGSAYILYKDQGGTNNWGELTKLTASDGAASDYFGSSVSLSGDYAIVGAYNDDNNGSAYIFHKDQDGTNSWGQLTKLTASDGASGDYFGYSVSLSGAYAIVGAFGDDDNGSLSGSAYVFHKDQGGTNNWGELTKLTASDGDADDRFGYSVSISGDYAIVGANNDDDNGSNSGSAYIFQKNQGGTNNWGQLIKLNASDGNAGDYFGFSVSLSGDNATIGANGDDGNGNNAGSAYIFQKDQGGTNNWGELTKLTASDGAAGDQFGYSVYLSGNYVVIGSPYDYHSATNSGSAYMFFKDLGGLSNWGEATKLLTTDQANGDNFGNAVAISGNQIIGGTSTKDTSKGATYIFHYPSATITQEPEKIFIICSESTIPLVISAENAENYQWQMSSDNGLTFNNLENDSIYSGVETDSLLIYASQAVDSNLYRCVVSNDLGIDYSNHAFLTLDRTGPEFAVSDTTLALDSSGTALLSPEEIITTAFDSCGIQDTTLSHYSFGCRDVDTVTIYATITDVSGNITTKAVELPVLDTIAPIVLTRDTTIVFDSTGSASVSIKQLLVDVWDNCCIMDTTLSGQTSYTLSDSGKVFTLDLTVRDSSENSTIQQVNVTVVADNTPPSLTTQSATVYLDSSGTAIIPKESVIGDLTDNYGVVDTTLSQSAFSCSDTGEVKILVTVMDGAGNTDQDSATIYIVDNMKPWVEATDSLIRLNKDGVATFKLEQFVQAKDNCSLTDTIITGQTDFTCSDAGDIINVNVSLTDKSGNTSTSKVKVLVADSLPPEVTPQEFVLLLGADDNTTLNADDVILEASDNCQLGVKSVNPSTFDCSYIGENTIELTVSDVYGNQTVKSVNITVSESEPPTVIAKDDTVYIDNNGLGIVNAADLIKTADDNCGVTDTVLTRSTFDCSSIGLNAFNVIVKDGSGNEAAGLVQVNVKDTIGPVLTTRDYTLQLDGTGSGMLKPENVVSDLSDNCGDCDIDLSKSVFSSSDIGSETVYVTAVDKGGNAITKEAWVTIDQGTGVYELSQYGIRIYPNPADEHLNVEFEQLSDIERVRIINLTGETLYERKSVSGMQRINLSEFPANIYILQIYTKKGIVNTKIIKK